MVGWGLEVEGLRAGEFQCKRKVPVCPSLSHLQSFLLPASCGGRTAQAVPPSRATVFEPRLFLCWEAPMTDDHCIQNPSSTRQETQPLWGLPCLRGDGSPCLPCKARETVAWAIGLPPNPLGAGLRSPWPGQLGEHRGDTGVSRPRTPVCGQAPCLPVPGHPAGTEAPSCSLSPVPSCLLGAKAQT